MNRGSARVDLPLSLFSDDEEAPDPVTEPKRLRISPELQALADEVEQKKERRKARPKTMAAAVFNRALVEVDEMMRSHDWSGATVRHLVALYDRMHAKTYGVEPEELGATERHNAMMMAANMVKHRFAGDVVACVEYMRWAWTREMGRVKWCRDNDRDINRRIGTRLMFASGALLTDYKVALRSRRP